MATWAPAFAAFAVVCFFGGGAGLKAYLTRLALWRCSIGWGVFLLIGVPLTFAAGALVKGTLTDPLPFDSLGSALALMGFMLFLGPVEEFGWRGVAQPLLQRHVAPIWAGLLIGATWGFWHFPAFYLSGTVYTDWSFLPFFIGNVTLAVIVTPLLIDISFVTYDVKTLFSTRISILALARPQYTPAPLRTARPFTLNPAHHLCW